MTFEIRGKKYDFGDRFTRVIDRGDKIIAHNLPDHLPEERLYDCIDCVNCPIGHLTVPAGKLGEYEVK